MPNQLLDLEFEDLVPNIFIAVDLTDGTQVVGTYRHTRKNGILVVQEPYDSAPVTWIRQEDIKKLWLAPMGYRATTNA